MGKRKRTESKCSVCSGQIKKNPKRPYGTTGTNDYCSCCDMGCTYAVSKTSVRMKAKKELKKAELISSDDERLRIKNEIDADEYDRETYNAYYLRHHDDI